MHTFFLVGLGGCCGAVLRYSLGRWILEHTAQARLPLGTLAVNILGCLVIGLLAGLDQRFACFATGLRVFLFTGLLGGFTTFLPLAWKPCSCLSAVTLWLLASMSSAAWAVVWPVRGWDLRPFPCCPSDLDFVCHHLVQTHANHFVYHPERGNDFSPSGTALLRRPV